MKFFAESEEVGGLVVQRERLASESTNVVIEFSVFSVTSVANLDEVLPDER